VEPTQIPLDRLTWTRWRRVVLDVIRSEIGGRVKLLFAALLALLLAMNGLNVVNSYVGRDFMTAIEQRSMPGFLTLAALYLGVFAVSTVTAVIYRFTEERLGLLWRHWMTRALVERYMQGATYYRLREHAEIPNPDQRIADDVRTFTTTTLALLLVWLNGTFTILAFSGVLWSISPLLFAVAVGYAAFGSVLTLVFGRPLLWLNYDQSDREASFRAELVNLRENAECVAVLHRESRIRERLLSRVDAVVENAKRIIAVNRNLGFFTTSPRAWRSARGRWSAATVRRRSRCSAPPRVSGITARAGSCGRPRTASCSSPSVPISRTARCVRPCSGSSARRT